MGLSSFPFISFGGYLIALHSILALKRVCGLILEAVGDGAFWLEIRFLACSVCACLAWVEVSLGGRVKELRVFIYCYFMFLALYPSG